jgi:hypothetical protein
LYCSERNVEQDGVKAIEPKAFDDQGAESRDTTAGDSTRC